ncbi:MAG: GIY-YIG nuclease family protein [Candidatus Omnitrophota bacterium]|nr:GIY-YIG nuclease family protein [Candidatus Omnitrophota bacterium]
MDDECKYCVYVLQSKQDKSFYIGYTNDLKRRVEEHNKSLCPSTKDSKPFRVAAYEAYSSEVDARTREKRLKQFKNAYKELLKRIPHCLER